MEKKGETFARANTLKGLSAEALKAMTPPSCIQQWTCWQSPRLLPIHSPSVTLIRLETTNLHSFSSADFMQSCRDTEMQRDTTTRSGLTRGGLISLSFLKKPPSYSGRPCLTRSRRLRQNVELNKAIGYSSYVLTSAQIRFHATYVGPSWRPEDTA